MRERVLVAMSGGVDSSVAAARLVEQGYDVVGATMKLFCYGDDVPDRPAARSTRSTTRGTWPTRSAFRTTCSISRTASTCTSSRTSSASTAAGARRFPACAATRSPSSATCWPTPTRSTAATSPPATTRWRGTAGSTAATIRSKDQSYFLWGIDRAVVARMLTPVGRAHPRRRPGRYARRLGLHDRRQARVGRDLLRARRRLRRRARAAPARRRAGARARPARHHHRRGDRRARGLRALHHRPAQGAARRLRRAALRRRDPAGAPRGGGRLGGRARRATGVRLEEINWLAGAARRRATPARCRSATARGPCPATVTAAGDGSRSTLALGRAGPRHHARAVGRALRRRRPRAGRRRDRA